MYVCGWGGGITEKTMHELHRIEPILSKVNSAETVIQNIPYICGKTNICRKSTLIDLGKELWVSYMG